MVSDSSLSNDPMGHGQADDLMADVNTRPVRAEDAPFRLDMGTGPSRIDPDGTPFDPIVDSFINDLSFEFSVNNEGTHGEGRAEITPAMRSTDDLAKVSVISTIADVIGGVPAMHVTSPKLALTLDMATRLVGIRIEAELSMTSDVVKKGSRTVVTEVRFHNMKSGELVALTYLSFMTSPRPGDVSSPIPYDMATEGRLAAPFGEFVGLRTLSPGVTELDRRPYVVQPAGNLQGGMVALLGESAAESLTGCAVVDLDVRFLTGVRVGPGQATAELLGNGLVRVEVRDVGGGNRLTALVTARVTEPELGKA